MAYHNCAREWLANLSTSVLQAAQFKKTNVTINADILNRRYHTRLGYSWIKFNGKDYLGFCS
ncbi:hypothetical protein EMIT0111MI5_110100 [Burkholderia sp. IT-111MI5]